MKQITFESAIAVADHNKGTSLDIADSPKIVLSESLTMNLFLIKRLTYPL